MTARITAADVVALRDAATRGPWVAGRICGTHLVRGSGAGGNVGAYVVAVIDSTGGTGAADAAFIAAGPAIVDELVAAEAENARLRETLADVCDILHDDPGGADVHGTKGVVEQARKIMAERDEARAEAARLRWGGL